MRPDRARVLVEGLITGLLGYAAVVLFYGGVNLVSGRSFFYTAALLGQGLVADDLGAGVTIAPGPVFAFNGIHLLAFVIIGLVAAWLVFETERYPSFFVVALFVGLAGFFITTAALVSAAQLAPGDLPWWTVLVANLLAGLAMGIYLARAHPRLWPEVRDHLDPETEHPAPP